MKNKLTETLEKIGLTENEARVYYAALSLGPATVLQIANTAEIKRTTVYAVIESLQHKGLMSIDVGHFKRRYVAEDPTKLDYILKNSREIFHEMLPQFTELYKLKGGDSYFKYYEGLDAIKQLYSKTLELIKPHEDYLVITDRVKWLRLDPIFFQNFIERRAKLNINTRILLQDSKMARELQKYQRNYNVKIKILPKDVFLPTNLVILPNVVMIHQLTEPIMSLVIENRSIVRMHREFFEIMWKSILIHSGN